MVGYSPESRRRFWRGLWLCECSWGTVCWLSHQGSMSQQVHVVQPWRILNGLARLHCGARTRTRTPNHHNMPQHAPDKTLSSATPVPDGALQKCYGACQSACKCCQASARATNQHCSQGFLTSCTWLLIWTRPSPSPKSPPCSDMSMSRPMLIMLSRWNAHARTTSS